jgi:hypothetical protein
LARREPEDREVADERILGSGGFVEAVWRAAEPDTTAMRQRGWEEILEEVSRKWGLERVRLLGRSRERVVCRARREFLLRGLTEGGLSIAALGRLCAMNAASISRAIDLARTESGGRDTVVMANKA